MNVRKVLPGILVVSLTLVSCTTLSFPRNKLEFNDGIKMGEEYAKRDAASINCWQFGSSIHVDGSMRARTFTGFLKKLEKSQDFISGFYWGYERDYYDYYDIYCGE